MIYLALLILSFSLTYFIKNYYIKHALLEEVNERSSHTVPTPNGGGIGLAFTWFIGLFYLHLTSQIDTSLFYALVVGVIISFVSFFDDLYDLSPKIRLLTQALVALCGLYFLGGFTELSLFGLHVENQILLNVFAFLLIVWFINLYNFLDGINGYAGSEIVFLCFAGFMLFSGDHFVVLAVASLGFLFWNFGNAKIFMGDVGSTLLGYNVAIFTLYYGNQNTIDFWVWIALFSLFWIDATFTLLNRLRKREKLSQAHKEHIYQRLTQIGWSHSRVVVLSIFINFAILGIVILIK